MNQSVHSDETPYMNAVSAKSDIFRNGGFGKAAFDGCDKHTSGVTSWLCLRQRGNLLFTLAIV